ncbi:MAG: dihydrodipicolinate synthase family protein [Lentisphaeria bacterium]
MSKSKKISLGGAVWSAAPTPFTDKMELDVPAVKRMVEHHVRLGVGGLFLAGTNGEGPWMTDAQRRLLVKTVVRSTAGRMPVAVQVSDNSAARILDNIRAAREDGADIAVIAPPYFLSRTEPSAVRDVYVEAIRQSPLPVGIYDRGTYSSVAVPEPLLKQIYLEKNVVMIKDSSANEKRMRLALEVKRRRPELKLLTGWEFECVRYLAAGFDGLLLGGGVFNGFLAGQIVAAMAAGDRGRAEKLQARMNRMMYAVYGGKKIACWLSGEKKLLVELGLFGSWRNYPDYPLTAACDKAIQATLKRDAEYLLP